MDKKTRGALYWLSATRVRTETKPGFYGDGGNLYLQVSKSGTKSWVFRYKVDGKTRDMGLGSLLKCDLKTAREKAADCRLQLGKGIDPLDARDSGRQAKKVAEALAKARLMTFNQCAKLYIEAKRHEWTNARHAAQWENTLRDYASPVFGSLAVSDIDTTLVMRALEPHWLTKTETMSRVRGRIELILGWATTKGYRSGENPARWRGHLENLLAKKSKVVEVVHHGAVPFAEIGAFIVELRQNRGVDAAALEFLILAAGRTAEVIGAKRGEFDLHENVWVIPADRMKAGKEHRVPLSARAIEIVRQMFDAYGSEYVFPNLGADSNDEPLQYSAMLTLLKQMGYVDATVHGFRSAFRTWAGENTGFPREVIEMALAHTVGNAVENAYQRGDLFAKRARLMDAWAKYINEPKKVGKVLPIRGFGESKVAVE